MHAGTSQDGSRRNRSEQLQAGRDGDNNLLQLLHVERLVQVQAGVLVLSGGRVGEPLQEPLQAKRPCF